MRFDQPEFLPVEQIIQGMTGLALNLKRPLLNIAAFAAQPTSLALSPDHASVPVRSAETSIVLDESIRRSARAQEAKSILRAIARFIRFLLDVIGTSKVGLDPQVSLALTPTGPLVYQWLG